MIMKGRYTMTNPVVTITMTNGDVMKAELYPEIAPNTVNNFISLVQKGFYDGLIFHRVISGFMIQGGDPQGTGMGGPGYSIKGEFAKRCSVYGTFHDAELSRFTVLHYACQCTASGWTVCSIRQGC